MFGSFNQYGTSYGSNPYDVDSDMFDQNPVDIDPKAPLNENMLIRDIILTHPDAAEILMRIGMGCITCPASLMESLGEACMVHGLDGEEVCKYMNQELNLPAEGYVPMEKDTAESD